MAVEGENLGTAAIYLTVDTTSMDAGIAKAKTKLAGMSAEAEKQYTALTASQRKVADSLVKQAELINKTTAERIAYNAQLKIGGALGDEIAAKALAQAQATTAAQQESVAAAKAATEAQAEMAAAEDARFKQIARDAMAEVEARQAITAATMEQARANAALAEASGAGATGGAAQAIGALDSATVKQQIADYAALDAIMGKKVATTEEIAAAEAALDRLQAAGMISNEELAASFEALDVVTAAETKALQANSVAQLENAAAKGVNSRTTYELGIGVGEIASGNINRLKRTGAALANSLGVLKFIMTPVGAGLTALVAAAAAVGVGMEKGAGEIDAYNEALAKTGDISGLTSQQLNAMSATVAKATGDTQHAVAQVLAQVVSTGKFIGDANQNVAQFAVAIEGLGGKATQAISLMASFGDDPVKGVAKLNDAYHLLSASVVDQVDALAEQGRTEEATALAERDAAKAATDRVNNLKSSLVGLPALAHDVGSAFKSMWDKIMDSGRQGLPTDPLARQLELDKASLASLQQKLDAWQKASQSGDASIAGNAALWLRDNGANIKAQIQTLSARVDSEQASADLPGVMQKLGDETARVNEAYQSSLPKEQQIAQQVTAATKAHEDMLAKLKALGASQQAINQENANYLRELETFANKSKVEKSPRAKAAPTDHSDKLRQMGIDDIQKQIAEAGKEADAQAKSAAEVKAFTDNLNAQLQTRKQVLDLQVQAVGMGSKEVQQQQELLQIQQQYEQKQAQLDREHADHARGMTDEAYAQESAALKAHYDADVALTKQHYQQMDAAQANWVNGAIAAMQNWADQGMMVADQVKGLFTDAFGQMNDALVNFVQTGKLSFSKLADSIIADLVRMELRIVESKILQSVLGAFLGGNTATSFDSNGTFFSFAKGDVFNSPSLSQYSGGVYDSPKLFKFASGGVFGEAGPEAIMPLSRGSDGKLGVKATGGGGNTTVIVENHSDSKAQVQQSKDSSGGDIIKVIVGQAVSEVDKRIARGGSTGQMIQQVFGLNRRGVPVAG